jgi:hypothetical protein
VLRQKILPDEPLHKDVALPLQALSARPLFLVLLKRRKPFEKISLRAILAADPRAVPEPTLIC